MIIHKGSSHMNNSLTKSNIGIIGDYGVRSVGYRSSNISVIFSTDKSSGFDGGDDDGAASGDENKLFVGMLIMLIFSEALAL